MAVACDMPVEQLELSLRTYLCLKRADLDTVADLLVLPAGRIAHLLESPEEALRELCHELSIHARGLLWYPADHILSDCMGLVGLGLSSQVQSRLIASGVRTLGQLTEIPKADLSDILGVSRTDAVLTRLWAYCVVRGRDSDGASRPPWLEAFVDAEEHVQHENKLLRLYCCDVSRLSMLNRADEVLDAAALARHREPARSMHGRANGAGAEVQEQEHRRECEEARSRLVESALAWVVHWAKDHEGKGLELIDLIQEGNTGLMRAADRYNYRQGERFTMYAWWWVRQTMTRAIDEQCGPVRIPIHVQERVRRFQEVFEELWEEIGREPTLEEVSVPLGVLTVEDSLAIEEARSAARPLDSSMRRKLGKAVAKAARLAGLAQEPLSLDANIDGQFAQNDRCLQRLLNSAGLERELARDRCLGDLVPWEQADDPIDAVEREQLRAQVKQVLDSLTNREREVIELRFGLGDGEERTLEEVGEEFGVSRERIRQIQAKALLKLRHPIRSRKLRDYLS